MWIKNPLKIIIILVILLNYQVDSYTKTGGKAYLNWQAVPGAFQYEVIIKNKENKKILKKRSSSNSLYVNLQTGVYSVKVLALNKLKSIISESNWFDITIKKAFQPEISDYKSDEKEDTVSVTVNGKNFLENSVIKLTKDNNIVKINNLKINNENQLTFNLISPEKTNYELTISNPGGKTASTIINIKQKEIIVSDKISNKDKDKDKDKDKKEIFNPQSFYITFGLSYNKIQSKWDKIVDSGYKDFNLQFGHRTFNYFGFEAESSYIAYDGKKLSSGTTNNLKIMTFGGGIFFYYPFKFIVPEIFFNGGLTHSSLDSSSNSDSTEKSSSDYYFTTGSSLKFNLPKNFIMETEINYTKVFYIDEPLSTIKFVLRLGYSF